MNERAMLLKVFEEKLKRCVKISARFLREAERCLKLRGEGLEHLKNVVETNPEAI